MPNPIRGLTWLDGNPHAAGYLRGLAQGDIPLTHEGLHALDSWRTTAHLRDLLMAVGALPAIDRQILLFERWYQHRLTEITHPDHAKVLRRLSPPALRQPVSRLSRLTVHDVCDDNGQTFLRLGSPPTPVPDPFTAMLRELAANRSAIARSADPASRKDTVTSASSAAV